MNPGHRVKAPSNLLQEDYLAKGPALWILQLKVETCQLLNAV